MIELSDWMSKSRVWQVYRSNSALPAIFTLALVYPVVVSPYILSLGIEVLIFAIFAMSLDMLLGYAGLPSFGHAAFFGLGAYILAYITSSSDLALGVTDNLLITIPMVILGTATIALVVGFFALRTSGMYFLMITLAAAQMLFSIAMRWTSVTGGSDGIVSVPRPTIGISPFMYTFSSRESFYYLVLILFLSSWWLMRRIVNSPFGLTLQGIRENEERMCAVGYNTFRYKLAIFAIAGSMAGLAGLLLAQFFWHAAPGSLHWTTSGQVLTMVIIGGAGTLSGPIMGAAVIRLLPHLASNYTDHWQTLMGLVFIIFVLFARGGIIGLLRRKVKLT
jgi:branched-chain amino acid transport system permease protein